MRAFNWFFRNRETGEITVAQFPNVPLWIFFGASLVASVDWLPVEDIVRMFLCRPLPNRSVYAMRCPCGDQLASTASPALKRVCSPDVTLTTHSSL